MTRRGQTNGLAPTWAESGPLEDEPPRPHTVGKALLEKATEQRFAPVAWTIFRQRVRTAGRRELRSFAAFLFATAPNRARELGTLLVELHELTVDDDREGGKTGEAAPVDDHGAS